MDKINIIKTTPFNGKNLGDMSVDELMLLIAEFSWGYNSKKSRNKHLEKALFEAREAMQDIGGNDECLDYSEIEKSIAAINALIGEKKCSQCGQDFTAPACGPTHAIINHERDPSINSG